MKEEIPDKSEHLEPPLKTFILFTEIIDVMRPLPGPKNVLAAIQATDEKAVANHFGGKYSEYNRALGCWRTIFLPKRVFKPLQHFPGECDMMDFRKDGFYICIDAGLNGCYIRIEEIPNIIVPRQGV